jgi:RNase adapter protein RapZ
MQLVIVSGLSGAGKTVALKQYEDQGFFCIDNLPLALVGPLSQRTVHAIQTRYSRLAVGIDARESPEEIAAFPQYLDTLRRQGVDVQVLFLTASDDAILRRYSETRRKHPLTGPNLSLMEAIASERELLHPIADLADHVIDTSDCNLHELREAIRVRDSTAGTLSLTFESFGYKNGLPDGMDFVFDVRCLPNPHWQPELRALSGLDQPVARYLEQDTKVGDMVRDIQQFLDAWLPQFQAQDRSYVAVGIGCTGGQHRSVYVAERLAAAFRNRFDPVIVRHREIAA